MVADKETPIEYTTIPSRENKKRQTGNTRFTLSQLRALPFMHSREMAIFGNKITTKCEKEREN
jgi:hypothetical protein